jgi:hypothetical protein
MIMGRIGVARSAVGGLSAVPEGDRLRNFDLVLGSILGRCVCAGQRLAGRPLHALERPAARSRDISDIETIMAEIG